MDKSPNDYTDIELIEMFKDKKEDKYFEILLKRHKKLIEGKASHFFSNNKIYVDYYDLTQEAILAFYNAIISFKPDKDASFATYASTCINNRLINFVKYEKKNYINRLQNDNISEFEDDNSEYEIGIYKQEENAEIELDEILENLEEIERNLLLYKLQGKSYKEIAELLKIKPKDVDNIYQKIKTKLRTRGNI